MDAKRVVSSVSRCLNPYEKQDYDAMMDVAAGEALEYIVSNTTEAGIVYDPRAALRLSARFLSRKAAASGHIVNLGRCLKALIAVVRPEYNSYVLPSPFPRT